MPKSKQPRPGVIRPTGEDVAAIVAANGLPTIQAVVNAIGVATDRWPNNCYAVASAAVTNGIFEGEPQYGYFLGQIHPCSVNFGRSTYSRYGWIKTTTGTIVDLTRWVFEHVPPYVYTCPGDSTEYDADGRQVQQMLSLLPPCPGYKQGDVIYRTPNSLQRFCLELAGIKRTGLTHPQVVWFASLPLPVLSSYAFYLYEWVAKDLKQRALIPTAHYKEIQRCMRPYRKL